MNVFLIYPIPIRHNNDLWIIAYNFQEIVLNKRMTPIELANWTSGKKLINCNGADEILKHPNFRRVPYLPLPSTHGDVYDPSITTIKSTLLDTAGAQFEEFVVDTDKDMPLRQTSIILCFNLGSKIIFIDYEKRVAQNSFATIRNLSSYNCYIVGRKSDVPNELKDKYLELPVNPFSFFCYFAGKTALIKHQVDIDLITTQKPVIEEAEIPVWLAIKLVKLGLDIGNVELGPQEILEMLPKAGADNKITIQRDVDKTALLREQTNLTKMFKTVNMKEEEEIKRDPSSPDYNNNTLFYNDQFFDKDELIKSRSFMVTPKKDMVSIIEDFLIEGNKFNSQIREHVESQMRIKLTNSDINKCLYGNPNKFKKNMDGSWDLMHRPLESTIKTFKPSRSS